MIWATVSSWSCFYWLHRASPSLATKNIINLISILTIWRCPCVVFSCVVGRGCLLWPMCSLGKTLLAFALLHSVLQGQICLLLQASPDFLLCIPVPYNDREGNGTPLQYSCLENPTGGGAWWAAVHGVAKSRTRLSNFTFTFHFHALEKEMATTLVPLPWKSHGHRSLAGYSLWQ